MRGGARASHAAGAALLRLQLVLEVAAATGVRAISTRDHGSRRCVVGNNAWRMADVVAPPPDAAEWRRWCTGGSGAPLGAERAAYARDGICVVRNAVPPALVEEARAHVAWLAEHNPECRPEFLDMMWVPPRRPRLPGSRPAASLLHPDQPSARLSFC